MNLIIHNGDIIDPATEERLRGHIMIRDGKIYKITQKRCINSDYITIEADGLTVVPGFIDVHTHTEDERRETGEAKMFTTRESVNQYALMGATTIINGNCGCGTYLMKKYYDSIIEKKIPVNISSFAGYTTMRQDLGVSNYAASNKAQRCEIKKMMAKGLEEGAIGISFGIEYTPGAATEELLDAASVISQYENAFISMHYRYDADQCLSSINEMIHIGKTSGVPFQISHIGSCAAFGLMEKAIKLIEEGITNGVDLGIDCYPYNAFACDIGDAVFDEGFMHKFNVGYDALKATSGIYKGKAMTKEMFRSLRKEAPLTEIIAHVMRGEEVKYAIKHPLVMIGSDGTIHNGEGHPRSAGTFPRVLGRYVNEGLLDFMTALKKMTIMPAKRFGLVHKGRICEGADADLVILNPMVLKDNATYDDPILKPDGIVKVIVNGQIVVDDNVLTGIYPGQIIRRSQLHYVS